MNGFPKRLFVVGASRYQFTNEKTGVQQEGMKVFYLMLENQELKGADAMGSEPAFWPMAYDEYAKLPQLPCVCDAECDFVVKKGVAKMGIVKLLPETAFPVDLGALLAQGNGKAAASTSKASA